MRFAIIKKVTRTTPPGTTPMGESPPKKEFDIVALEADPEQIREAFIAKLKDELLINTPWYARPKRWRRIEKAARTAWEKQREEFQRVTFKVL